MAILTVWQKENFVVNVGKLIIFPKCVGANSTKKTRRINAKTKKSKCSFLSQTLQFFGQTFSADGIKPDPTRILDLQNAPKPNNVHDVRSLLGMANYSSRYIANFATIAVPLRELTKKNVKFEWNKIHQLAFDKLTPALSSAQCMAYFDTQKDTYITVDASPVNISAILSQKNERKRQ